MKHLLEKLLKQERELQFESFTTEDAWILGSLFVEKAREDKLSITIDINRHGHQLFHFSMDGTSPDNDQWVQRKARTVERFGHSSYYVGQTLKSHGKSIEEKYLVSETQFAAHGGSFPLIIKEVGPVGTITVSGLSQEEDHNLVVEIVNDFLLNKPPVGANY